MRSSSSSHHPQIGFFDITDQLDANYPLIALSRVIDWDELESAFAPLYVTAKPTTLYSACQYLPIVSVFTVGVNNEQTQPRAMA